jgi:hypothetical protein
LDGNVEWTQKKLFGCPNTTILQPRYGDINYTSNTTGTFAAAQCSLLGWLGRKTAGIDIGASLTGVTSSSVKVDRVSATGAVLAANVFSISYNAGMIGEALFNDPSGYSFIPGYTNSSTQGDNFFRNTAVAGTSGDLFRITVTATTAAGTCTSIGFFRLQGGVGSQNWRVASTGADGNLDPNEEGFEEASGIQVYPNPANNSISFDYYKSTVGTLVTVRDIIGKTALVANARTGTNTIDISTLTQGIYFVELVGNGTKVTAKFVKE